MATMDLLKATINGKIGNVYGARQRAQTYLKAVPFSHTPHSQSQTKSVRAFEKLNRLSAGIAKGFWQFMGLSDRKMLKHNAVAALLKPAIENKTFLISNLGKVIKKDGTTEILNFVVDRENNSILLEAQTTEQFDKKTARRGSVLSLTIQAIVISVFLQKKHTLTKHLDCRFCQTAVISQ